MNREKLLEKLIELQDKVFDLETKLAYIDETREQKIQILSGLKVSISVDVQGDNDFLDELCPVYKAISSMQEELTGIRSGSAADRITDIACDKDDSVSNRVRRIMDLLESDTTED